MIYAVIVGGMMFAFFVVVVKNICYVVEYGQRL